MLSGLADSWPASSTWTIDQLSEKYGEVPFRISQRSPNKISMKFKDYISYMKLQRDEDPLYVFDDRVREICLIYIITLLSYSSENILLRIQCFV